MNNELMKLNNRIQERQGFFNPQTDKLKAQRNNLVHNDNVSKGEIEKLYNDNVFLKGEIEKYKNNMNSLNNQINSLKNIIKEKDATIEDNRVIIDGLLEENKLKNNINDKNYSTQLKSIGLDNIGATCYMNATLQCLSHTPELKNIF